MQLSISSSRVLAKDAKATYELVQQALVYQKRQLAKLERSKSNPSVSSIYYEITGIIEALEAVSNSLTGDKVNLKTMQG